MRKGILTFLLVIGVVALIVPGIAMGGVNVDMKKDVMNVGDDYTRTWKPGDYNAWTPGGLSTEAGKMWGGWDWAAQFIAPCPQWLKTPTAYGGKCNWDPTVNTDYSMSPNTQTKWGSDKDLEGTIVDDLYARVVDHWRSSGTGQEKGVLDQDLDILFGRRANLDSKELHVAYKAELSGLEAYTTDTYIDQALDQQLAYWEDVADANSVMDVNTENGLTQRLVNDFTLSLLSTYDTVSNSPDSVEMDQSHLQKGFKIDQWVVQWLRDIDIKTAGGVGGPPFGKEGIEQYYSSWFELDEKPTDLNVVYNYTLGHNPVVKTVTKGKHDVDPNDGVTYKATGEGDTQWDP